MEFHVSNLPKTQHCTGSLDKKPFKINVIVEYGILNFCNTTDTHEDLGKFPNCLNSIPNENLGLKKENDQKFFCKYVWTKKSLLVLENSWSRPKIAILVIST